MADGTVESRIGKLAGRMADYAVLGTVAVMTIVSTLRLWGLIS